jgi:predicted Zn-dependent protease
MSRAGVAGELARRPSSRSTDGNNAVRESEMKYAFATVMILLLLVVVSCSQKSLNSMVASTTQMGTSIGMSTKTWGTQVGQNAAEHGAKVAQHVVNLASLSNESREDDLGQSVGVVLTNTYPVLKNDALQKYVTLVGLAVASNCPRPDIIYTYGILDTDEVNAFSGPNGYIFITTKCRTCSFITD